MGFATVHGILAVVGKDFIIKGLQTDELRDLAEEVLTETGRHNRRACPLRPQMVIWLVVAMALFRTTSIANVFQRLIRWTADLRLGRRPVTAEALCHARDRLNEIGCCLIDRPRRNRQCPRKVKRKMSNFQLKRSTDHEKILDLTINFLQSHQDVIAA